MEQNFVVLQGKVFTVDIPSMFGSTNYGWCLTSLPAEIILMGAESISTGYGSAAQRFYFGAISSETINVDIPFVLMCWSDFTQAVDTFTAHVRIVPSDGGSYTPYSENANMRNDYAREQMDTANAAIPYGVIYNGNNAAANTPIFRNNTQVNTPIFGNNVAANTPIFRNNTPANTPIFRNNAPVNTPIFSNNAAVSTPIFGSNLPILAYGYPTCC